MEIAPESLGPVIGHADAKREWLSAVSSGRMHHGWLLRGPRGVGKARMALQMAGSLLGAGPDFAMTAETMVGRLVVAGSHPDLRVLQRLTDDKGKTKTDISVDQVRELIEFFAFRPAMGGWRVAIIDAVDELNRSGLNAMLKTLEEPPERAVLLLVYHGEQAIPPTIRSRCRVLNLGELTQLETVEALEATGIQPGKAAELAAATPGRPGRAIAAGTPESVAANEAIRSALRGLERMDARALHQALNQAGRSDASLAAAMETLTSSLQRRAAREIDPVIAGDWAAACLDIMRLETEARELNMDRAQTVASALQRVAKLAR